MSTYKILDVIGGPQYMDAYGVNAEEVVVGASPFGDLNQGIYHAFADLKKMSAGDLNWIGGWVDLNPPGAERSSARAVNGAGTIVGNFSVGDVRHGFIYEAEAFVDLNPVLGASWSMATDINDRGQVVGGAVFGPSADVAKCHAFLYDPRAAKPVTDLGTLQEAPASWANAINNLGHVVGWSGDINIGGHPFQYSAGALQDLTGQLGTALDINDAGLILAATVDALIVPPQPGWYTFIWRNGQTEVIPGDTLGRAINNLGQVVGMGYTASGQAYGFIYDSSGLRDLNDLIAAPGTWRVNSANAINNNGEIAAEVLNSQSFGGPVLLVPESTKFDYDHISVMVEIMFGVKEDGGGVARLGGYRVPIGPWDPRMGMNKKTRGELAAAQEMLAAAEFLSDGKAREEAQRVAKATIARIFRLSVHDKRRAD